MARRLIIDPEQLELDSPLVSLDEIRRVNPQRNEMEQLTAIVYIDPKQHVIAGYKDVGLDEHWVRGHMPDYPLMPGVLMCEAAAQRSRRMRRYGDRRVFWKELAMVRVDLASWQEVRASGQRSPASHAGPRRRSPRRCLRRGAQPRRKGCNCAYAKYTADVR